MLYDNTTPVVNCFAIHRRLLAACQQTLPVFGQINTQEKCVSHFANSHILEDNLTPQRSFRCPSRCLGKIRPLVFYRVCQLESRKGCAHIFGPSLPITPLLAPQGGAHRGPSIMPYPTYSF